MWAFTRHGNLPLEPEKPEEAIWLPRSKSADERVETMIVVAIHKTHPA